MRKLRIIKELVVVKLVALAIFSQDLYHLTIRRFLQFKTKSTIVRNYTVREFMEEVLQNVFKD